MKLRLEVSNAAAGGGRHQFEFAAGPVNVGRSSSGHVVIEGTSISRVHCILDTVHGAWHVTHNGSASPTYLNGVAIPHGRPSRISDGDRVVVADYEIRMAFAEESVIPAVDPLRDSVVARMDEPPPPVFPQVPVQHAAPDMPPAPPPGLGANPGPAGQAVPTLIAYNGVAETLRLELKEIGRNYSLGRAATCDMSLPNNSVSRQHAFARFDGTRVYIRDAAARNPLRINGRPIVGETPLSHGDVVSLGPVDLQFVSEAANAGRPQTVQPITGGQTTMMPARDERATMMGVRDERGTMMPAPQPAAPEAAPVWKPSGPASMPAASSPGWDAMAHQEAGNMPWAPAPPAPSFPETRAAPMPSASAAPAPAAFGAPPPQQSQADWSAMSAKAGAKPAPKAAWDIPAPAAAAAPPPPPAWDIPAAAGDIGGVPWAGPPPVAVPTLPSTSFNPPSMQGFNPPSVQGFNPPSVQPFNPPSVQLPPMPPPAMAPPPFVPPPPPQVAMPGASAGALKAEPRVVTRRSSSQRGWLVAGVICMIAALTMGFIFILICA